MNFLDYNYTLYLLANKNYANKTSNNERADAAKMA